MTRYQGNTDTAAMPGTQYRRLREQGVSRLLWTMWVAADGLPRQLSMSVPLRTQDGTVRTDSVSRFSGWGDPVSITAPAPTQVATIAEIAG